MKNLVLTVAVALISIGCATTAPTQNAAKQTTAEGAAVASADGAKKPKMICTRTRVTGTHLYKDVCRSERQVEEERSDTQNRINSRPEINTEMGN